MHPRPACFSVDIRSQHRHRLFIPHRHIRDNEQVAAAGGVGFGSQQGSTDVLWLLRCTAAAGQVLTTSSDHRDRAAPVSSDTPNNADFAGIALDRQAKSSRSRVALQEKAGNTQLRRANRRGDRTCLVARPFGKSSTKVQRKGTPSCACKHHHFVLQSCTSGT